jgi:hypothetical protein
MRRNNMPSTVGTSTTNMGTYSPFQRKAFYVNGRFWVFYSDGTNIVYRTSTDGLTWTSPIIVKTGYAYEFSVWFDGTYLHYANAYGSPIYYRRGIPNSNGTITWSAPEQVVSTTYNIARYPFVSVDSDGYVWIGYMEYTGTNYYPYVIKSGNNDGTWGTTPDGFPHRLSTTSGGWRVSVIPLILGKIVAFYTYTYGKIYAKPWDGSAWGVEEETTSTVYSSDYYSVVAEPGRDWVHLAFHSSAHNIIYVKYTYPTQSGGFGTETTLQTNVTHLTSPVISIGNVTDVGVPALLGICDLYVFWAGSPTANHIYYRKYNLWTETWEPAVDWIDESAESLTSNDPLTSFYEARDHKIGLAYMTKTSSPYNVKFAYLTIIHKQAQEMMRSGL